MYYAELYLSRIEKKTSKWANGRKYCKDLVFYVRMSNMI
jgi:hypothetical protein